MQTTKFYQTVAFSQFSRDSSQILRAMFAICHFLLYRLDLAQPEGKGGFRRSYQTLDHLTSYRLAEQKCWEWSVRMCVSTVDFMKAFDSMSYSSLWSTLK